MKRRILSIALFTPLRRLFDYYPPDDIDISSLLPGMRVSVPFGKGVRIGVIVSINDHSDYPLDKIKSIHAILDNVPLFPSTILKLIDWASQYYHCSLGEVFDCALPTWLCKGKSTEVKTKEQLLIANQLSTTTNTATTKPTTSVLYELNPDQQHAVDSIQGSLQSHCFNVFLLEGVTGSGKTEVYIRAIELCLAHQRQALILVPEIGLTPQMLARFQERFDVPVGVLHSSLSEKKRFTAWIDAASGHTPILIGTRSAAFTPLKSPGLFIIDEEHDPSFKQQDHFRYSARDLLIKRASLEQCPIVLGSATPSLETQQNTEQGRYRRLSLPKRAGKAEPPIFQIVDIRHKKLTEGLSSELIKQMQTHLNAQGQVLLFLNRRGFAPVLMCFDCGYVANCKQCDARLTVHYKSQRLRCHHCEFSLPLPHHCPSCQSKNINPLGIGTERIESTLQQIFQDKHIVRIDRDTTRHKGQLQEAITKIQNNEADILIGTQMLAKGHHFPNVTLVGILNIDHALFSTDFRSFERLGQLLTQVAGRAGRAERLGQVLLQTCHPNHPLLKTLIQDGYKNFTQALLLERRATQLPPFSHQALIRADARKSETAFHFLEMLKSKTQEWVEESERKDLSFTLLGPVTAPMERKENYYRSQLLIQSLKRSALQTLMKQLVNYAESLPTANLRWSLDVDPIDMF